jgi:hypothetical protein
MSSTMFQSRTGSVPHPRTANEWMEKGYSPDQAEHKIRQDVFGHDYKVDAKGNPIEQGKGSAAQQTLQHKQSLERIAAARRSVGYTGAEAYDPRKG